ncbi:hypothetical protein V6N13_020734 [Hibiscus sabdariffa]
MSKGFGYDRDEREIVDTLRHAGEWIRDQGKITKRNRAWTKEMAIHVVTMAQDEQVLEPFLAQLKVNEGHPAKRLLKDIMDLGNIAGKFL